MHPDLVIQHLYDQLDQRKNRQQQINKLTSQLIKEQRIQPGDHNNPNSTEYYFWLIRNPDERKRITQTIKISFWELK